MGLAAWKHSNANVQATVSTNKTLTAADSGIAQVVDTDAVVISVPATVVGQTFIVRNGSSAVGTVGIAVSPVAADNIAGNGFTAADNKDAINTKATAEPGDEIIIVADGANGYFIQSVKGVWAREA